MSRYLLIALAIAVGGLIGLWLSRRSADQSKAETLIEEGKQVSLWPWIAGAAVLAGGLLLLAFQDDRADISLTYQPATITEGGITPGEFEGEFGGEFESEVEQNDN